MNTLQVRVIKKHNEAADICSFMLADIDGGGLPPFSAGAHIDVHMHNGMVRQYSLCNSAMQSGHYLIAVLKDPNSRGGSVFMHENVNEDDVLHISAPRNHFPLAQAGRTLLFAGGIGVTPILCMAEKLHQEGQDFSMYYSARSLERTAFYARIRAAGFSERVAFGFDSGEPALKIDIPGALATVDPDTHLYICGPAGFIDYVVNTATGLGWPKTQIHLEYFGAAKAATAADAAADLPFQVQLASTGAMYLVPAGKSVTEILDDEGISIPVSCEQGVCGTCVTRVLNGMPDHRDVFLSDTEHAKNDRFTPCCSRSLSDVLVLDI